jgi:Amt family ammonium transporter
VQALMVVVIAAWVAATTAALFFILKKTIGLRVTREEEIEGLDVHRARALRATPVTWPHV